MNLGERLRGVVRPGGTTAASPGVPHAAAPDGVPVASGLVLRAGVEETLGGEWRGSLGGRRYLMVDRCYPLGHRLGHVSVADCIPGEDGTWPGLRLLVGGGAGHDRRRRVLFVDLETTGLAGGAGTYAFLVGIGWFEPAAFHIRQFLLTSYAAERALLDEVMAAAGETGVLATYNGKTFDLPLLDTRFLFHRLSPPFGDVPHLDMLHQARRLWRSPVALDEAAPAGEASSSCRLSAIEASVLGHVRRGDVPGAEIPHRYFHFVRTGDVRPLEPVLEHNRLDLLALAMLTATAATLLHGGPAAARTAGEALGMGRLYERAGFSDDARACFERAGCLPASPSIQAQGWRAYGRLCRRLRQFDKAAEAWRRILALRGCPRRIASEATEALAVHHEHRVRDLVVARRFAAQTLAMAGDAVCREDAQRRLARLDRRLGSTEGAPLFPGRR